MKTTILGFFALMLVLSTGSCKKCYTCVKTVPKCATCVVNGIGGSQYCEDAVGSTNYNNYKTACLGASGVWDETPGQNLSEEVCESSDAKALTATIPFELDGYECNPK